MLMGVQTQVLIRRKRVVFDLNRPRGAEDSE